MPYGAADELIRASMKADFLSVNGLKPVTYRRRREDGTVAEEISVPAALKRATEIPLQINGGIILPGELVIWHVPADALALLTGRPQTVSDDVIDPDEPGIACVVLQVELQTFDTRYRLTCQRVPA